MKKLGVFITTHIGTSDKIAPRHGPEVNALMFDRIKFIINKYVEYKDSGINDDYDINIMDTGSDSIFIDWIYKKAIEFDKIKVHTNIDNFCGFAASIKHVMHKEISLMDEYEYFLFHTDDGVYINENGWAKEIIDEYKCKIGIMGREKCELMMDGNGLYPNNDSGIQTCKNIAEIWGIMDKTIISHVHGDWWLMNRETLLKLANAWYDPIKSEEQMNRLKKMENTDFTIVQRCANPRMKHDMDVGREVDTALRILYVGGELLEYKGNKIKQDHDWWRPLV